MIILTITLILGFLTLLNTNNKPHWNIQYVMYIFMLLFGLIIMFDVNNNIRAIFYLYSGIFFGYSTILALISIKTHK